MVVSIVMNLSEFRKVFSEEFDFISGAFTRCQWPKPVESDEEGDDSDCDSEAGGSSSMEYEEEIASNPEPQEEPAKLKTLNRAGTIQELLQRQNEIRSNDKKESRKRKNEEPKKKHKMKKKKKKMSAENSTSAGKLPAKVEVSKKSNSTKGEKPNADVKQIIKHEIGNNKVQRQTRAPIKHGADVVVNEEGSMLFSKLAFTDSVEELKPKLGGPKQPKHVLGKLEKVNKLISSLEERGKKEKAQRLKENMSWSNAFYKAEGAKVKDNTVKVQKSVKQLAKQKRASERKWKKRLEEIKTKKETKDRKREQHIQKRVDQKKERKLKKLIKRGRFIPELKTKPS